MKERVIATACLVGLACVGLLARPNRGAACSIDTRPGARLPGVSHLIVVATNRVVSAARHLPPGLADAPPVPGFDERVWRPGMRWWWGSRLTRWFKRLRDRPPYGQVATLEQVGGPDSARIAAGLTGATREIVIVYWSSDGMCRPALRTERTPALTAGERIFLTATLRDRAGWVDGRPTFDLTLDHFVYYERDYRERLTGRGVRPLTAGDVMSVYEALPDYEALQQQRDTALVMAPLRTWARAHPTLAVRPPADGMIDNANTYARRADQLAPFRDRRYVSYRR